MKFELLILCLFLFTIKVASSPTYTEESLCKLGGKTPTDTKDCTEIYSGATVSTGYNCCLSEYKFKNKPLNIDQEGKYCEPIDQKILTMT